MIRVISGFTVLSLFLYACNRTDGSEAERRDPTVSAAKPTQQGEVAADNSKEGGRQPARSQRGRAPVSASLRFGAWHCPCLIPRV